MSAKVVNALKRVRCLRCETVTTGYADGDKLPCCWLCERNDEVVLAREQDVHEERSWPCP